MSQVLHRAEEHGQARPLTVSEVGAFALVASIKAIVAAMGAVALVTAGRLGLGENVSLASIALVGGGVFVVSLAFHVWGDLDTLVDGLRSWRSAESYAPSVPQQPEQTPHPPILVRTPGGSYLDHPDEPLALPPPKRERLELTPTTVSVILREIVEEHDGLWSRARIMGIKVKGQRVPRRIYEQLTMTLSKAGLLAERARGGYEFPHHVKTFDDLGEFFPGLSGPAGRPAGGPERGDFQDVPAVNGKRVTLAEQHRARREASQLLQKRLGKEK